MKTSSPCGFKNSQSLIKDILLASWVLKSYITFWLIVFQNINIRNNPVQYISPHCLRGTHVKNIFISPGLLKQAPSLTQVVASVKTVEFNYNEITYVSESYFNNCTKLEGVAFSGNIFQRLPNWIPIALTLQRLYFPTISLVTSLR